MAQTPINFTSTYAGKDASTIMGSVITPVDIITDMMTLVNVKDKLVLQQGEVRNTWSDYSATFNGQTADEKFFEKYLVVEKAEIQKEYNFEAFRKDWQNVNIMAGSQNDYSNANVEKFVIDRTMKKLSTEYQRVLFGGKEVLPQASAWNGGAFTGLIPKIFNGADVPADQKLDAGGVAVTAVGSVVITAPIAGNATVSSTVKFTITSIGANDPKLGDTVVMRGLTGAFGAIVNRKVGKISAINGLVYDVRFNELDLTGAPAPAVDGTTKMCYVTASNVVNLMSKFKALIPYEQSTDSSFMTWVSPDVASAFEQVISSQRLNQQFITDQKVAMEFGTFNFSKVKHNLPPCTILFAKKENLYLGVDLLGEESQLRINNLTESTGDEKIRLRATWKFGTQYNFGSDISIMSV